MCTVGKRCIGAPRLSFEGSDAGRYYIQVIDPPRFEAPWQGFAATTPLKAKYYTVLTYLLLDHTRVRD